MGVVNTKSNAVTNGDATPKVMNNSYIDGGMLREKVGFDEVAAADDDTSVYRFVRVSSGARISSIEILNDAITGGTDYDVGLHETEANGGAAVDANLFADAIDIAAGNTAWLDVTFEALNIDKIEKRVWEALGLTEDPGTEYDVTMTGSTVGTGAGTIAMRVRFVV